MASANTQVGESTSIIEPGRKRARSTQHSAYSCVAKELKSGKSVNDINIGLQMSVIKPMSANWFISAYDYIHFSRDIICNGFRAAGIFHILNMV